MIPFKNQIFERDERRSVGQMFGVEKFNTATNCTELCYEV